MDEPWSNWIPGVLAPKQVKVLEGAGFLDGVDFEKSPPEGSAFNLHITENAWSMKGGAVKPHSGTPYHRILKDLGTPVPIKPDKTFRLDKNCTYVFELREQLQLPKNSGIHGQATARSSVGRVDVLARLIVDGMDGYEFFKPTDTLRNKMYLEVTPMTFPVRVRAGTALSQLRLFYGAPEQCILRGKELARTIRTEDDNSLHIDLIPFEIGGQKTVAFQARKTEVIKPIDLWEGDGAHAPDPWDYWNFCRPNEQGRLRLEQDVFYIFRSVEHLALPAGVAAYCMASDETIGEMRIHYAGFIHPWFGRDRDDGIIGTPLIFEVRGHDLSVSLRHREVLARMTVYRMSEDVPAPTQKSKYSKQGLKLSGFFGQWPHSLSMDANGNVTRD